MVAACVFNFMAVTGHNEKRREKKGKEGKKGVGDDDREGGKRGQKVQLECTV